jgi:hypothetical protein
MNNKIKRLKIKIYGSLLKLDCAVLKKDFLMIKFLKRYIFKKIGYYFRKKYYGLVYK